MYKPGELQVEKVWAQENPSPTKFCPRITLRKPFIMKPTNNVKIANNMKIADNGNHVNSVNRIIGQYVGYTSKTPKGALKSKS